LIVSGIKDTWTGNYWVDGKKVNVQVNVTAFFDEDRKYLDKKYIEVYALNDYSRSHAHDLNNPDSFNWSTTTPDSFEITCYSLL